MAYYMFPNGHDYHDEAEKALNELKEAMDAMQEQIEVELFGDTIENILSEKGIKGVIDRYNLLATLSNIMSLSNGNPGLTVVEISPSTAISPYVSTEPIQFPGLAAPVIPVGNVGFYQSTGNTGLEAPAKPAMILTVPLRKLITLAAPAMGFSLDPDFFATQEWINLREALVQYCWDGTEVAPVLWDSANQAYIDARFYESLEGLANINPGGWIVNSFAPSTEFQQAITGGIKILNVEEGTQGPFLDGNNIATAKYRTVSEYTTFTPVDYVIFPYRNSGTTVKSMYNEILISSQDFSGVEKIYRTTEQNPNFNHYKSWSLDYTISISADSYTFDGKTVYYYVVNYDYGGITTNQFHNYSDALLNSYSGRYTFQLGKGERAEYFAWNYLYNYNPNNNIVGYYSWQGDLVDYTSNAIEAVASATNERVITRPYYPIHIVIGDPDTTYSPLTDPNPKAPTAPPQTIPYISPQVQPEYFPQQEPSPSEYERTAPLPTIVPGYNPVIQPTQDPYQELSPDELDKIKDYEDTITIVEPPSVSNPPSAGNSPSINVPDPDGWPTIIPLPASSTGSPGLVHVYNPTPGELYSFGQWLWVTYADPSIEKLWNNPFDGVISAHELYATPDRGAKQAIRSGFLTSDTSSYVVPNRYTEINCGNVFVPEFFNNYLDYAPYTKVSVYLPFIGFVELDANDVINHGVNITYKIDSYSGACIAQITSYLDGYSNTIYQFTGNCSSEIPLAGGSQAAIRAAMLTSAAYGVSGLVMGGGASIPSSVSGAVNNLSYATSKVAHSGSFGGSYGAMGSKRPYIVVKRQRQIVVTNYNEDYGFPAHKRVIIGTCTGYIRVREVNVVSSTATDNEKQLIEQLLKEGVYVN